MGSYVTVTGQNIYDVTTHIYGSLNGLTDLLINNPNLSLSDIITTGTTLQYTDDLIVDKGVVTNLKASGITPANGSRGVYFRPEPAKRIIDIITNNKNKIVSFSASGAGSLFVDWGDNNIIKTISLSNTLTKYEHIFNYNQSNNRKIKMFGDVSFISLNVSDLVPLHIYFLNRINIEKYTQDQSNCSIEHLKVSKGIYSIDIQNSKLTDLSPLVNCTNLMRLSLLNSSIPPTIIENYLIKLVSEYGTRRGCTVTISPIINGSYIEPSRDSNQKYIIKNAMEAVWVLTHEVAWQQAGYWKFIINNKTYTTEK